MRLACAALAFPGDQRQHTRCGKGPGRRPAPHAPAPDAPAPPRGRARRPGGRRSDTGNGACNTIFEGTIETTRRRRFFQLNRGAKNQGRSHPLAAALSARSKVRGKARQGIGHVRSDSMVIEAVYKVLRPTWLCDAATGADLDEIGAPHTCSAMETGCPPRRASSS